MSLNLTIREARRLRKEANIDLMGLANIDKLELFFSQVLYDDDIMIEEAIRLGELKGLDEDQVIDSIEQLPKQLEDFRDWYFQEVHAFSNAQAKSLLTQAWDQVNKRNVVEEQPQSTSTS